MSPKMRPVSFVIDFRCEKCGLRLSTGPDIDAMHKLLMGEPCALPPIEKRDFIDFQEIQDGAEPFECPECAESEDT